MRRVLLAAAAAAAAALVPPVVLLVGLRTGEPHVLRAVRRFNRDVTNPRQLRTAGQPGSYASLLEHVGRRTGTAYRTPVGAMPVDDALVVALPYGAGADWVRNVLAHGSATVTREGRRLEVGRPEVVPVSSVLDSLSPGEARTLRLLGVRDCLRLHPSARPPA